MDTIGMDDVIAAFVAVGVAAGPLALGVTKIVDFVRNLIDADANLPRWCWNGAAFVVGIGVCVGWGFNLVAGLAAAIPRLSGTTAFDGVAGEILTGIIVAGTSGYWHEHLDQKSAEAKANVAIATGEATMEVASDI